MARTSFVGATLIALFFFAAAPSLASAADNGPVSLTWLASDADGGLGRLVLDAGHLAFHSMHASDSWDIDLASAKRVDVSKDVDKHIEVETVSGERFVFKIVDAQLLPVSPRKALQTISVALKSANAAGRMTASASQAPAPPASPKVVGVNGGQVR